jgi:hypothetical protein
MLVPVGEKSMMNRLTIWLATGFTSAALANMSSEKRAGGSRGGGRMYTDCEPGCPTELPGFTIDKRV